MAREKTQKSSARQGRGWVQDTTLYIGPTSTAKVELQPEWEALTSQRLARAMGISSR